MWVIKNTFTGAYLRDSNLKYLIFSTKFEANLYIKEMKLNTECYEPEWTKFVVKK